MPSASGAELSVMVGQLTEIVYSRLPAQPLAFVAVTVKLNEPAAIGEPEMTPSELNVKPAGSAPLVIAKLNESLEPSTVIV